MKHASRRCGAWSKLALAAVCAALAAGAAAGPAEDAAQAETEFARGDLVASLALWKKAADQGHAPAQARLGDILDKSEDDAEAAEWYRKAAAQNNAAGQYGLGRMAARGEGVAQDFAQARTLLLAAAAQDHPGAIRLLMEGYRDGTLGLAADAAEAARWEQALLRVAPPPKPAPAGVPARAARRK